MSIKRIESDQLSIGILLRGASLVDVRAKGVGRNLVLGFADPLDHRSVPIYAGAIIGPIANRVRSGLVHVGTDTFQMPLNENEITTLHSGPNGLHALNWSIVSHDPHGLTLRTHLPDGACGLPGNRTFTATYDVQDTTLTLTLTAQSDRPTAINLAAHPYWNLDGKADISGHHLQVWARHVLPVDADNLPTGDAIPLQDHQFDFRHRKAIPLDPALDLNFCLSDHMRQSPVHAAELTGWATR
jgi:aldose 1-epimerase